MRKRYRILLLAAIVAALIVPVGFALSLESAPATPHVRYATTPVAHASVSAPAVISTRETKASSVLNPIPDGAKLFVVGTALVGLAAIVRRAV